MLLTNDSMAIHEKITDAAKREFVSASEPEFSTEVKKVEEKSR
jgi:hypothetical protein